MRTGGQEMSLDSYLDNKLRDLTPPNSEWEAVQWALDAVSNCLDREGETLRIAERYPCGSFEKKTMLKGRKEGDFVVVLREPFDTNILEHLERVFSNHLRGVRRTSKKYKALEVTFENGANVDILPVARAGLTTDATMVEPRFRVGVNGRYHTQWFVENAHGTVIQGIVRLLKAIRDAHSSWAVLSSFSIELLAVESLRGFRGGLAKSLLHVLTRIKNAPDSLRELKDPADSSNRPLESRKATELEDVGRTASRILDAIERGNPSFIFLGETSPPHASTNLGGRSLG